MSGNRISRVSGEASACTEPIEDNNVIAAAKKSRRTLIKPPLLRKESIGHTPTSKYLDDRTLALVSFYNFVLLKRNSGMTRALHVHVNVHVYVNVDVVVIGFCSFGCDLAAPYH
jgi:hypothetical protein